MSLVFNLLLGLTVSTTDYSKGLNYDYESVRAESYGLETTLELDDKYFAAFDLKRLAGNVQSSTGLLNVFGWNYTHDVAQLKLGFHLDKRSSFYFAPTLHYFPILFPTQVGALSSTAAFEKTLTYGLAVGYKALYRIEKIDLKLDANLSYLDFASSDYDSNYSFAFDIDVNPTYEVSKKMNVGINYNLLAGQTSVTENITGSQFPFKTTYFLHNFFLTFEYTLQ